MKNTLSDLNNHLFACLERLNDENISEDDLRKEIKRANAVSDIASNIVANANVQLQAIKYANGQDFENYKEVPKTLIGNMKNE
jgi:benzoyl-CoA reductase/2-hydroxyglutaryl-CoA dehydratase subunit BcrC/BadD/HgdB